MGHSFGPSYVIHLLGTIHLPKFLFFCNSVLNIHHAGISYLFYLQVIRIPVIPLNYYVKRSHKSRHLTHLAKKGPTKFVSIFPIHTFTLNFLCELMWIFV